MIEQRPIVEHTGNERRQVRGGCGCLAARRGLFIDGQRSLIQGLRPDVVPPDQQYRGEVTQRLGDVQMVRAERRFADFQRAGDKRFRAVVLALAIGDVAQLTHRIRDIGMHVAEMLPANRQRLLCLLGGLRELSRANVNLCLLLQSFGVFE